MDAGSLIRDARHRHGLDQRTLARRARTSQTQLSRIERNEVSPSVSTLARILAAVGERLELLAVPNSAPGTPTYFPGHAAESMAARAESTEAQRVLDAISLSETATRIAAAARDVR